MFGKYSYLIYMLIFTIIPIGILWFIKFQILIKNIKIILMTAVIGVVYQFIVDPFAEGWKAWFFSNDKILGIWLFNFPIENILFFILITIAISSAVIVSIHYEEEGKLDKLFKPK